MGSGFDPQRRSAEVLAADAGDLKALEAVEKWVKGKKALGERLAKAYGIFQPAQ